jgi:hypothetical protein
VVPPILSLVDDFAAQELLEQVTDEWAATGVLRVLCNLVDQVWRDDLARHRPDLGDDAMSLGMQASRNLCNLAVRRLQRLRGVQAKDRKTLEVSHAGRVLHVGKAPSDSPLWDVSQVDWADSDVREHAAAANTAAYQSSSGTLFEDWDALPEQNRDPSALLHLHLTWQGLADGSTRSWLGFPQLGSRPWFAVLRLDDARLGDAPVDLRQLETTASDEPITLHLPDFDVLPGPETSTDLDVTRDSDVRTHPEPTDPEPTDSEPTDPDAGADTDVRADPKARTDHKTRTDPDDGPESVGTRLNPGRNAHRRVSRLHQ